MEEKVDLAPVREHSLLPDCLGTPTLAAPGSAVLSGLPSPTGPFMTQILDLPASVIV